MDVGVYVCGGLHRLLVSVMLPRWRSRMVRFSRAGHLSAAVTNTSRYESAQDGGGVSVSGVDGDDGAASG